MDAKGKFRVLIADDSEEDRFFLRTAIGKAAPLLRIIGECQTGQTVISYLTYHGSFDDREKHPMPHLLVMDWRMPEISGRHILAWLKENPVPGMKVAVLADASGVADKSEITDAGALFFEKKMNTQELLHTAQMLQEALVQAEG